MGSFKVKGEKIHLQSFEEEVEVNKDRSDEEPTDSVDHNVTCDGQNLIKLELPENITSVSCKFNKLRHLKLPESVKRVYCNFNMIEGLEIPDGVKMLSCHSNNIKELVLPPSIEKLFCDNFVKIKNLEEFLKIKPKAEINLLSEENAVNVI